MKHNYFLTLMAALTLLFACQTQEQPGTQVATERQDNPGRFFNDSTLTMVGAYYYPEHWDPSQWDRDLQKMASLGFEFVHMAEFAWAQLEPKEGVYDFAWLDTAVMLSAKHGLKVILCTSTATPPVWLSRKYPDILILNEDGSRWDHGARQHPSYHSTFYRDYSMRMIAALGARYGQDERVIGWQLDNEPKVHEDFNPDAQQRFRTWLRERYQTIEALNKAWGTAFWGQIYQNFEQINIPRGTQLFMNNHQRLDYRRFCAWQTASFLDEQARTLRKHTSPDQFITTNYIPAYDDGHIGMSRELDFCTYTRYMVYGEKYGLGRKGYRVGPMERIAMANDFFRPIDQVYGVMELQPGQVNWGQLNAQLLPGAIRLYLWHVFAGGSKFTCTYRFRQPLYGTELYHYGIIGPDGVTTSSGGLEYAQFIKEIQTLRDQYSPGAPANAAYEARRTAILYNHENAWSITLGKQTKEWDTEGHILKYYSALKSFAAPVDIITEDKDFSAWKVMIVPAYQQVDDTLIGKLTQYVQNGGNLVLTTRSGHKTRNGQLFEAEYAAPVQNLMGGKVAFYDLMHPGTSDPVVMDGAQFLWHIWGDVLEPAEGTEVWARYEGDFYAGKAAVTFRALGKGTVTYVGPDSDAGDLERAVLQKLYARLGIPVLNLAPGVTMEYRDGFGIGLNYSDQPQEIPIPADAAILIGQPRLETAGVVVWKDKSP